MRAVLLAAMAVVMAGCASDSPNQGAANPLPRSQLPTPKLTAPPSETPAPSSGVTTPPRPVPSLEQERQAQARRLAGGADATQPAAAATAPASAVHVAGPADRDAPSWFSTTAKEVDGRVVVGAMADAASVREAPRLATDAAKTALAKAVGSESQDVRVESTYVRKQGDGYRAFVLVSCPGTIKK